MKDSLISLNRLAMWIFISLMVLTIQNVAQAQIKFELAITKTCPGPAPVPPGTMFQCTFTVQSQDPDSSVIDLAVTSTVPFPGGVTTTVPCNQLGVAVTVLGPAGTATNTCTGAVNETAPACGETDIFFFDQIAVTGIDQNNCPTCTGTPVPLSASGVGAVLIAACCPPGTEFIICVKRNILLIKDEIILLPGELFPAPGNRQALLSGLDTVLRKVEDQKFDDASHILGDLRKHLDGCASADGTSDSNDWINSCGAQTRIRSLIDQLIAVIAEI
jgi:hypothetical protein